MAMMVVWSYFDRGLRKLAVLTARTPFMRTCVGDWKCVGDSKCVVFSKYFDFSQVVGDCKREC